MEPGPWMCLKQNKTQSNKNPGFCFCIWLHVALNLQLKSSPKMEMCVQEEAKQADMPDGKRYLGSEQNWQCHMAFVAILSIVLLTVLEVQNGNMPMYVLWFLFHNQAYEVLENKGRRCCPPRECLASLDAPELLIDPKQGLSTALSLSSAYPTTGCSRCTEMLILYVVILLLK